MIDLLEHADPARGLHADADRLRAKVDERVGMSTPVRTARPGVRRPWLIAAASFIAVLVVAIPLVLRQSPPSVFAPGLEGIQDLPGVTEVTPLASGGLQTMATDGDSIWVMTMLANQLQRISVETGDIEATYPIDSHVEGVIPGGGYVWLLSYGEPGEVLRFDPASGVVDLRVPVGGQPWAAKWFEDSLWVGNDLDEVIQVSADGEILSTVAGQLKGEGLGYLWVNDPETGLISSLDGDGVLGEIVIPSGEGLETMSGNGVRQVTEANGELWLLDGDYPWGTNLSVFDPETGELRSFGGITFGLLDIIEFDGYLWVTSHTDHLLIRIDPATGEQRRYPMPGKAAGLEVADGALWVSLYHPGALIRLDTRAELIEAGPIVADDWGLFPQRLLCTANEGATGPTIVLEPADWIEYGAWSVIQARLTEEGHVVCAHGYMDGEASPEQRAADLAGALTGSGLDGPYLLASSVDGVHTARLFADGRDDVAAAVLVDPVPVGFRRFYDAILPELGGHPPWLDLESPSTVGDLGDVPVTVIGQDPEAVFLSRRFVQGAGVDQAEEVSRFWQDGLGFYAGLSTESRSVVATGTGLDMVIWDRPELVVQEILELISRIRA